MTAAEANFDGIVGPTHNYGGLAVGNLASAAHARQTSHPKRAALQGLAKAKALADLGLIQGVLPPQDRPDVGALRRLGFSGTDSQIIERVAGAHPRLLEAVSSASAMWAANAATVSPSADTADGRVHFTAANLAGQYHRSIEAATTARVLAAVFPDPDHFTHHPPLPAALGDEGAANHTRLATEYGRPGVELFAYGRVGLERAAPRRVPARQTLEASQAIARLHRLQPERTVYARQNPEAVEAGVFHNDVIAVGNLDVLFHHELAFADSAPVLAAVRAVVPGLRAVEVPASAVSLDDAVSSYLFNGQLVVVESRSVLVAPQEVEENQSVARYLDATVGAGAAIEEVRTFDVRESMQNGGGPACLRLRVVLTSEQHAAVAEGTILDDASYDLLVDWVERHYRETLTPEDLGDPALLDEGRSALDELTRILRLGSVYDFQL